MMKTAKDFTIDLCCQSSVPTIAGSFAFRATNPSRKYQSSPVQFSKRRPL